MNNKLNKENKMKNTKGGVRHGEVILIPVKRVVGKITKRVKKFIVAHSETGHHHVIESEVPMSVAEKEMYIELFADSAIVHKKSFEAHKTLPLEKGIYKRYEAVEYDPFSQIVRRVVD